MSGKEEEFYSWGGQPQVSIRVLRQRGVWIFSVTNKPTRSALESERGIRRKTPSKATSEGSGGSACARSISKASPLGKRRGLGIPANQRYSRQHSAARIICQQNTNEAVRACAHD